MAGISTVFDRTFRIEIPAGRHRHVDGLRAIAVLLVVLFHAGLPGFSGGFVGVDIFFVISGYLILTQIIKAQEAGRFSLMDFWARRVLRIVPALLVMVALVFAASLLLLHAHEEWEEITLSSVTASLFLSNIYFFLQQGYFDTDAYAKPLLHTWSLGVEQQFYFLAPLLLMAAYGLVSRPRFAMAWLAFILFAASLALTILYTPSAADSRNGPFYLTPFRSWAFILGGFVPYAAWWVSQSVVSAKTRQSIATLLGLAGIALIVGSGVLMDETTRFPGWVALLPTSGTVMVIVAGLISQENLVSRLLSTPTLVAIGVVSYGWYLWHWPLISLGQINAFAEPDLVRNLVMSAISFGLAVLSWRWIEQPAMRWKRPIPSHDGSARIVLQVLVLGIALAGIIGGAGAWYYGKAKTLVAIHGQTELLSPLPPRACPSPADCGVAGYGLLVGDSHADRLEEALEALGNSQGINILFPVKPATYGLPTVNAYAEDMRQYVARMGSHAEQSDYAVVNYHWSTRIRGGEVGRDQRAMTQGQIEALSDGGRRRVLVLGPMIDFYRYVPECTLRAQAKGLGWEHCALPAEQVHAKRAAAIKALEEITANLPNTRFIDPIDLFCDDDICRSWVDDSLLYADSNHLSLYGARYVVSQFADDFLWAMTGRESGNSVD